MTYEISARSAIVTRAIATRIVLRELPRDLASTVLATAVPEGVEASGLPAKAVARIYESVFCSFYEPVQINNGL